MKSFSKALSEPVRLQDEHAGLTKYRLENRQLIESGVKVECVFFGDSITERWRTTRPAFFSQGWIDRGITGQTTTEMLLRFRADAVALSPCVIHLMAGTNDIAGNTGQITSEGIVDNIKSMCDIAFANGISVIVASIPPALRYPWRKGNSPVKQTQEVNHMLTDYARSVGMHYADYYAKLSDGHGGMRPGYAIGEVHPTSDGYAVMEPLAKAAIKHAIQSPRPKLCYAETRAVTRANSINSR